MYRNTRRAGAAQRANRHETHQSLAPATLRLSASSDACVQSEGETRLAQAST